MKYELAQVPYTPLRAHTSYLRPPEPPMLSHLDDPAIDVMTDFRIVRPVTVAPDVKIDDALAKMQTWGVRLLLVTNPEDEIAGTITAMDMQGDRPIRLAQESRLQHSEITVEMVMSAPAQIPVLNILSVRNAQVGHIVEILKHLERQHILVAEVDETSHAQRVVGLFSTTQIGKQLWRDVSDSVVSDHAHSLTEIVRETG